MSDKQNHHKEARKSHIRNYSALTATCKNENECKLVRYDTYSEERVNKNSQKNTVAEEIDSFLKRVHTNREKIPMSINDDLLDNSNLYEKSGLESDIIVLHKNTKPNLSFSNKIDNKQLGKNYGIRKSKSYDNLFLDENLLAPNIKSKNKDFSFKLIQTHMIENHYVPNIGYQKETKIITKTKSDLISNILINRTHYLIPKISLQDKYSKTHNINNISASNQQYLDKKTFVKEIAEDKSQIFIENNIKLKLNYSKLAAPKKTSEIKNIHYSLNSLNSLDNDEYLKYKNKNNSKLEMIFKNENSSFSTNEKLDSKISNKFNFIEVSSANKLKNIDSFKSIKNLESRYSGYDKSKNSKDYDASQNRKESITPIVKSINSFPYPNNFHPSKKININTSYNLNISSNSSLGKACPEHELNTFVKSKGTLKDYNENIIREFMRCSNKKFNQKKNLEHNELVQTSLKFSKQENLKELKGEKTPKIYEIKKPNKNLNFQTKKNPNEKIPNIIENLLSGGNKDIFGDDKPKNIKLKTSHQENVKLKNSKISKISCDFNKEYNTNFKNFKNQNGNLRKIIDNNLSLNNEVNHTFSLKNSDTSKYFNIYNDNCEDKSESYDIEKYSFKKLSEREEFGRLKSEDECNFSNDEETIITSVPVFNNKKLENYNFASNKSANSLSSNTDIRKIKSNEITLISLLKQVNSFKTKMLSYLNLRNIVNLSSSSKLIKKEIKLITTERINESVLSFKSNETRLSIWRSIYSYSKLSRVKYLKKEYLDQLYMKSKYEEDIKKDLTRTFPEDPSFLPGMNNFKRLFNLLIAYSNYNPKMGYAQGLNFIAGNIIRVISSEEESFLFLDSFINKFDFNNLIGLESFCILEKLDELGLVLQTRLPYFTKFLETNMLSHNFFTTNWLITIFSSSLKTHNCLKVWDFFILYGWNFLFSFIVSLLSYYKTTILEMNPNKLSTSIKNLLISQSFDQSLCKIIKEALSYLDKSTFLI